jgi:hypothetical protein
VPNSKASAALARFVSLQPTNLAQKAAIIVEHFRQQTAGKIGGQAKAMVVARSRLHAVRYKQAIDAYIAKQGYDTGPRRIAALVAFSGTIMPGQSKGLLHRVAAGEEPAHRLAQDRRFVRDDRAVVGGVPVRAPAALAVGPAAAGTV